MIFAYHLLLMRWRGSPPEQKPSPWWLLTIKWSHQQHAQAFIQDKILQPLVPAPAPFADTCSVLWEIRFPNLEIQSPPLGARFNNLSPVVVAQTKLHIAQGLLGFGPLSQAKHGCLNCCKCGTVSSNKAAASSSFKIYKLAQQQTPSQWSHSVWQF